MSARNNLNPNQLRMFMTAQELHDHHSIDVMQTPESRFGGGFSSMRQMWETKRRENRMDGLDKSVAERGVIRPVQLTAGRDVQGTVIQDGHHRIQAAFQHNPQSYLPVEHHDLDKGPLGTAYYGPEDDDDIPPQTNRFPSYP